MALISFDKDTVIEYVPAYGNNRESENPCVVRLKFVPYSRVQHYAKLLSAKARNTNDSGKMTEAGQEIQRKQFVENVEGVSGYCIGDREVKDPGEVYDTADMEFVHEIIRAMESQQKLSEGQKKNFKQASVGI